MTYVLSTPAAIPAGTLVAAPQPVLPAGGDLVLRPWDTADVPAFLAAYRDPAIQRWHTHHPATEDHVREWFDGYRRDWALEKAAHWAVTRDGGEVLGRLAMRGINLDDGNAGCAYWVVPAARGAGVATRALTAVSTWAMDRIGFHRLALDHSTRNEASCRVATKAGYVLEGTQRSAAVHADGRHDMHLHARVRSSS
ncbi:GNAT family N-acetyltransferase [Longispora fulva]|uniref:RimJ/RimL family protein N-acetyltransferase n=1 Tax=Longispora fulva TaxID=619741 RepID=A0A8J7GQ91_9ACTN|nr:GNAT family N-acetyltransferase [Longispora fulva]MBG6134926.1 RimJ/RimL family protein N-acetyltransferase [Longispora fulva]